MKKAVSSLALWFAAALSFSLSAQDLCFADNLHLSETVRCHPSSTYLELAFDIHDIKFEGQLIFQAHVGQDFISNVWMKPDGKMLIHSDRIGESLSLCQAWQDDCCRSFVVPACTEQVCPLMEVRDVRLVDVDMEADVAHYQFTLRHAPPLGATMTEFAVLDEHGVLQGIPSVADLDSVVDLYTTISVVPRTYAICDLFDEEHCRIEIVLPTITRVSDLADLGVKAYPNPVTDQVNLDLGDQLSTDGRITYQISNSAGQLMAAGVVARQINSLPTDAYPAGMYYLTLSDGRSLIGHHRFVKLR